MVEKETGGSGQSPRLGDGTQQERVGTQRTPQLVLSTSTDMTPEAPLRSRWYCLQEPQTSLLSGNHRRLLQIPRVDAKHQTSSLAVSNFLTAIKLIGCSCHI